MYDPDGYPITIRCVAVWDTVGSLGLSIAPLNQKFTMLIVNRYPGYRPIKQT